jgi:hypothetical protein
MLSVGDAEKLTVPLGIYISKDEPVDEVLKFTLPKLALPDLTQYIKILDVIAKKPFATKNDNKYYSNM